MTTESTTQPAGGFAGDPADAFTPPSAGGCCGGSGSASTADTQSRVVSTCCGTAGQAQAEGACCGTSAKEQAVASGAECCG